MKIRVTIDAQTFEVEVGDLSARPIPVSVEGDTFMVWPEEEAQPAAMAAPPPASPAPRPVATAPAAPVRPSAVPTNGGGAKAGTNAVTAPIPGVIISVTVKEGDSVHFGQELCILEAMKMKNAIRANRAGRVAAIRIAPGDQVRHGQVLLEYTD